MNCRTNIVYIKIKFIKMEFQHVSRLTTVNELEFNDMSISLGIYVIIIYF